MAKTPEADLVRWVATEVLPHEADVRAWLRRFPAAAADADDVVQEAYCRLSTLTDFRHIASPRAYFFQTARSIVLEQMRRARIVRIEAVTEIETLCIEGDELSPERIAAGRTELEHVMKVLATLPERSRRIFEMRRMLGFSQREIAERLGVSENIVENEATRALKTILVALGRTGPAPRRVLGRRA
ncbi:RNA polymerase sigma factor [Brevundimonas sp. PAMC22021]|uniref:RNA polymerase sigma factor n=1 Tax=Brevundimonas sp. PAMC22021 TaxID=2861285 RepID=UPI001C639D7A|nr:sigma-70 family RNA polymerase sigma factor [Brevundimonas sp. PAMC22021]QYF85651.1 sigma-70 family RNA polymerase sigma factor [Brevundimonas sp. PAMC22021]